ncbi:hypothetical protein F441_07120 [Phytophthora nicotianae CJ01A1]|uniref:Uncharacterized protein n=2 Tax=Phytophthora nicotianae TaxID=4792 RepID=W2PCT6_PHYN3|nr:hypothetical protein PPTG_24748 [Phytophthora nicotianae INRA-310]ETM98038.1 hypothetical protein PPTG_24748 [Phytophthora nicotianae INRA-310]ETP18681.1 hypothetical protein F441_07120 [Phytophthora nicotianae CJ01A1]
MCLLVDTVKHRPQDEKAAMTLQSGLYALVDGVQRLLVVMVKKLDSAMCEVNLRIA